ncbi:MAG TPA: cyclase family protein [Tissierellales bacterium]|nr:cyclase family protein [Tissierellales bacterium]
MKIDLTVPINKRAWNKIIDRTSTDKSFNKFGHIGTHFDLMDKKFNLENFIRPGKIFDVSSIKNRDIETSDINTKEILEKDFVIFYTEHLKENSYGTDNYFQTYPNLSKKLVKFLIKKKVSLIGIDTPGIRQAKEHREIDQYCADNNVFIVENLNNLDLLLKETKDREFLLYTFPINLEDVSGLPCRVIAEI